MENSSTSKLRRQSVVSARSKGQHINIFKRGNSHLAEDERRHEFSLDSLDKEILQTMSRGSKNTHVSLPSESASESSGSTQEKVICSRESPHSEPVPHIMPNGVHSSESTAKASKKTSEQNHGSGNIGQFQAPPLPMWTEADARSNGYKQQVFVNVNGGSTHQQDPSNRPPSGATVPRPGGNHEMHGMSELKDPSFRDVHSLNSRLDAGLSSDTSGEDTGAETRRKQASEVYSGSMGNRSQQRSAVKSKIPKAPSSKWDDAGKWIASSGHNVDSANSQSARSYQESVPSPLLLPGMRLAVAEQVLDEYNERDRPNLAGSILDSPFSLNENGNTSSVNETSASSVTENSTSSGRGNTSSANGSASSVRVKDQIQQIENAIQNSLAKGPTIIATDLTRRREAPHAGAKRAGDRRDTTVITSTMFVQRPKDSRLDGLVSPRNLLVELQGAQNPVSNFPTEKPPLAETPTDAHVKDIFTFGPHSRSMSDFPSSKSVRESGTDTAQNSSSKRDMGTQMTPNPSVRLSRGATPPGTYNISPSRHNTPDQSRRTASLGVPASADMVDLHIEKLGRRNVGTQPHPLLDRNLNWSTREEEEEESATCLRTQDCGETQPSPYVTWAAAWEEAERAKYTARFHQEQARIQAWEELHKAKAETQMRKTELKLEKMHESASQKMSNKIAAAHRKAEDMRAAAEACRAELATRAEHRAEYIRQTGNAPTALSCFASRLVPFQSNLQ